MKTKILALLKFDTLIVILIFIAFSLLWISWGKLNVSGWDLPTLYRKMTKATNTILFFTKKDSPHLAYVFYIVPALGLVSSLFLFNLKRRAANFFLLLTSILGVVVSIYMYYYFFSSKIFKLTNAGFGIHLLFLVCLIGLFYSLSRVRKKKGVDNLESEKIIENDI